MKKINQLSSVSELNAIKVGDSIQDGLGNQGKVRNIEVLRCRGERQYYFRIKGGNTILVIQ